MRIAALGTAAGGLVAVAAGAALPVALVLGATAPFAVLLAAHAAAFLGAARRARAAPRGEGLLLDRRAFVGAGSLAFLAVLLGAPLPSWAQDDNPGDCKYDAAKKACTGKCDPVYDKDGKEVTLTCLEFRIGDKKDPECRCVHRGADLCKEKKTGKCTEKKECPDLWEDKDKRKPLKKDCLAWTGGAQPVCYCAYTRKK